MKNVKRLAAIGVGLLMTSSLFTGCSTDGLALANAFGKSQSINSMVSKSDFSINVSTANLSAQEKQVMDSIIPMINSSKFSVTAKVISNQEKTSTKVYEDLSMQLGQMPINMNVWANIDLSGDKLNFNEIVKMPDLLSAQMPAEFKGKNYMVMNFTDMENMEGVPKIDYDKLIAFSKDLEPKFNYFIGKYADQFNPNGTYISKTGVENLTFDGKTQQVTVYEVKLTDSSMKALLRYTAKNLGENPDAINWIRNYLTTVMSVYDSNDKNVQIMKAQLNKALIGLSGDLPTQVASINKALDTLDTITILGSEGMTIKYSVNSEGYIVNEKGTAQFVVDIPQIIKVASPTEAGNPNNPTGIYTINLTFNTNITNINEKMSIEFPELNSSNSFNYTDMLKTAIK